MWKNLTIVIGLLALLTLNACQRKCGDANCSDHGFCNDGECLCEKWYSGDSCELLFNRNYEGVYYGEYTYENGMRMRSLDSAVFAADVFIPNRLIEEYKGFYLYFETDSTLSIPEQTIRTPEDTLTIIGSGRYDVSTIQFEYQVLSGEGELPENGGEDSKEVRFSGTLVER